MKPISLADLAAQVQRNADSFEKGWRSEELAKQLRNRRDQLTTLNERAHKVIEHRAIMLTVDPKLRIPKRKLSPAVKKLEKLEATLKIDITKIVETDALDAPALLDAFAEVEQSFLENWQKHSRPGKDLSGADALANVPELEEAVQKLRTTRDSLEVHSRTLPTDAASIASVRKLQEQIRKISEQLQTHGLDGEVLAFLTQTRTANKGVPVADLLSKPKVIKWLQSGKHSSQFLVIHKSTLSPSGII